ncbi:hypothetical protein L226DRAFT_465280 [Lentinus tigrinus ALCF2SS1-7]|uniref:Uncharacterized protein n=1 Tax=Lentinus tigrinus ALCF2SS1-6 TaxID=1328759 RepID=A0A5C2S6B5_9APHY|nr:hypothetical protein L227DRAFT_576506 [Lentinus tigrinus ALCF2SS1-6]RPD73608.1 hypothetical protein L226DRAFT_465280 [Lentinus tigrinus ALCF2SS1-7]
MSLLLLPIVEVYRLILQPVAPFTWFGLQLSTLDVVAAFRLCVALRQIREKLWHDHVLKLKTVQANEKEKAEVIPEVEERSFVRDAAAALLVVYGGEAVMAPALSIPPSFMYSGVVPAFYTAVQATVDKLPWVPAPSLQLEMPLALFDGFSRAYLLCNLIPPMVLKHASPELSSNPWTLLLTSLLTANGGFFFTNMFSFFHPYALTLTTPTEFLPYGWTTTDLWCAPVVTGLYAFLTHAQPFWADAHAVALGWLGTSTGAEKVVAVDPETARAVCVVVLATLFSTRAARNFGPAAAKPKTKVQ